MRRFFALLLTLLLLFLLVLPVRSQSCGVTYTVQEGDTLTSIAEKCGLEVTVLIGINFQMSSPDKLWPGQVIRLEAEAELPTPEGPQRTIPLGIEGQSDYIVRPGDSLARLAMIYNTTLDELHRLNPELGDSDVIRTGQVLRLPDNARQERGWVGVSLLEATRRQRIRARAIGFHPNADVVFHLHEKEQTTGGVKVTTRTNARGEARALLEIPTTALNGEEWVVEVTTVDQLDVITSVSVGVLIR